MGFILLKHLERIYNMENKKEIKRKIRNWKKIKRNARVGTELRRNCNKEIRKLKKQLALDYNCDDPEKMELIDKIQKVYKHYADLTKYTKEELIKHLDIITRKE